MATPRPFDLLTLGWGTWAIVVVVLMLVLATGAVLIY